MSLPVHPDVRACPHCRLAFPSPAALRRHDRMDHRPAPDGERLTSQCLGTTTTTTERPDVGPVEAGGIDDAPGGRDGRVPLDPTTGALCVGPVPLLALALLVALVVVLGAFPALALAVMVWGHWARWHRSPRTAGAGPSRSTTP